MEVAKFNPDDLESSRIGILIRHGESTKNVARINSSARDLYPLTERGREQAARAAMQLQALFHVDALYTSPVLRARETAAIISDGINVRPIQNDLLWERRLGRYEEYHFRFKGEEDIISAEQQGDGYPDIESWKKLTARVDEFTGSIRKGEIAIAVTHGDPIKAALGQALGKNEAEMDEMVGDWFWPPASMTIMDFESGRIFANGSETLPDEFRRR